MYEDYTVEEKYLHNFSPAEKRFFYRQHQKRTKEIAEYTIKLNTLVNTDSQSIFANLEPEPSSALEIKYVLNRIAANDHRDTAFELGTIDSVLNPDKLALDIAKAFRNNDVCKTVVLNGIGLTDTGMLPILKVLSQKELVLLDISGNRIADETLGEINEILKNPKTRWNQVRLGRVILSKEQAESLNKHLNISFEALVCSTPKSNKKFTASFSRIREA